VQKIASQATTRSVKVGQWPICNAQHHAQPASSDYQIRPRALEISIDAVSSNNESTILSFFPWYLSPVVPTWVKWTFTKLVDQSCICIHVPKLFHGRSNALVSFFFANRTLALKETSNSTKYPKKNKNYNEIFEKPFIFNLQTACRQRAAPLWVDLMLLVADGKSPNESRWPHPSRRRRRRKNFRWSSLMIQRSP
jgi:hypothetical protein